jgi:uncharacterized membrane protein (UPF0127 family)
MRPAVLLLLVGCLLPGCSTNAATADRRAQHHRARDAGGERSRPTGTPTRPAAQDGGDEPTEPDAGRPALDGRVVLHGAEGEVPVRVEVVKTTRNRSRGLMFRQHLDDDAGMLFLFRVPEHQTFWMRNTLIPLDMIFIGADRRVVGVSENAQPQTDRTREVEGESQFVLEVNAGFARRWGIGSGSRAEFVDIDETGVDP